MGKDKAQSPAGWSGPVLEGELRHEFRDRLTEKGLQDLRIVNPFNKNGPPFDSANHEVHAIVQLLVITPGHITDAAHFTLVSMPGCCGVMVSTRSEVNGPLRRRGVGLLMQDMKEYIARRYRIGKLVATVIQGNKAEESLLIKSGWSPGKPFRNGRTGNMIVEWEKVFKY